MSEQTDRELQAIEDRLQDVLTQMGSSELMTDFHKGETYLRGNSAGLTALALEAIRVAQGKASRDPHVRLETWNFQGFIYDERMTETTVQKAQRRWKWSKGNVSFYILLGLVLYLLLAGLAGTTYLVFMRLFR